MILSTSDKLGEFEAIEQSSHIATVWKKIEDNLPKYWSTFVEQQRSTQPGARLATHFGANLNGPSDTTIVTQSMTKAIQEYEDNASKYLDFFHPETMEEFLEDPNAFKVHLSKEIPVIAGGLNNRSPELEEWRRFFWASSGSDLLAVFSNVMQFKKEWIDSRPEEKYNLHDKPSEFGLDPLDEDPKMTLANVIGKGIKGVILYHLDARVFPQRARDGIYALYFLSGRKDFNLPSNSSEFLMINDKQPAPGGSLIMEHNYFYPFGLYSFYAMRIFRWLQHCAEGLGTTLNPQFRYVYVSKFLDSVRSKHSEEIHLMRAHDRFGIPA